jgi:hypothetical protein
MDITLKTNRSISIVTVIYMILLAASVFIKVNGILITETEYYGLNFLLAALYVFLLIYLIRILVFLNEPRDITAAFMIYTCFEAIQIIIKVLPAKTLSATFSTTIGLLDVVIIIYLLIMSFNVKNTYVSSPYRLFACSLVFVMVAKLIFTVAFAVQADRISLRYLDMLSLFMPLAILFILRRTDEFIKDKEQTLPPGNIV